jgi:hypothetical protein
MRLREGPFARNLALLGVCAVAVALVGVAIASLSIGGGGGIPAMPTTGAYAPLSVPKPPLGPIARAQGVEPDAFSKQGTDLQTVMARTGSHRYQLTIVNSSTIGFINSFYWSVPAGVSITELTKVTGVGSGHCALTGTSGVDGRQSATLVSDPKILCEGLNLKPPTCSCFNNGGKIVISFIANTFPGFEGSIVIVSATPVLKIIPSYLQPADVHTCAHGTVSTHVKPCYSGKSGP